MKFQRNFPFIILSQMNQTLDALELLGLTGLEATKEAIERAFRELGSKYHTDKNPIGGEMVFTLLFALFYI